MKRGFTLLEITVAVAVVTILTVIAVLSFSRHRSEAQKAVCASQRNSIAIAAEHWLSKNFSGKTAPKLEDLVEEEGTGYFKETPTCPCAGTYTITLDEDTKAITVTCSYEEHGGEAEGDGGDDDEGTQTVKMGATRPGGWSTHGNSFADGVAFSTISTYNANSEDGLFELEPNSEYEFTIEVPASLWNETKGQFLQTVARVYSDYDGLNANGKKTENVATIVCGSSTMKSETDPGQIGYIGNDKGGVGGSTGYNTGSTAAKMAGYSAEATMETVGDVVRTTVVIATGDKGGKFGANFLSSGVSYSNKTKEAATKAIESATLTRIGDNPLLSGGVLSKPTTQSSGS